MECERKKYLYSRTNRRINIVVMLLSSQPNMFAIVQNITQLFLLQNAVGMILDTISKYRLFVLLIFFFLAFQMKRMALDNLPDYLHYNISDS